MHSCKETTSGNADFLQGFYRTVETRRIPFSGMLSLTNRCNLKCAHCYLRGKDPAKGARKELDTDVWISLIDDIVDAGCLYMTLTGGEPLTRQDFSEIYRHAKEKGLVVSVFSNATLISDDIVDLFLDLPPRNIDVTLYGATADTCDRITGIQGSFHRCIRGIEALLAHDLPLSLKTVLISLNRQELPAIRQMARDYGVEFRHDASIFPCLTGEQEPLELRVAPEDVAALEFSDLELGSQWRDYFEKHRKFVSSGKLYSCGTGLTSFYINPYGNLQPCLMLDYLTYDLTCGDFLTGWNTVIPEIREKEVSADYQCHRCEKRVLCGLCPAFSRLENGDEEAKSKYLCALGENRFRHIMDPALSPNIA